MKKFEGKGVMALFKIVRFLEEELKNNRGIALIAVVMVSMFLAMAGSTVLAKSGFNVANVNDEVIEAQVFYAAESGVEYALSRLKDANLWTDWSVTNVVTPSMDGYTGTANITFDYDSVQNDGDITVVGTFRSHQKTISLNVSPVKDTPFDQATCGCDGVSLNGVSVVDSYDGSVMTYEDPSNPITDAGGVGSNTFVDVGAASILGNVVAGTNLSGQNSSSVSGTARLGGNADSMSGGVSGGITENINPPPQPCDCDAIDVDTEVAEAAASNNNDQVDTNYLSGTEFSITSGSTTLNAGIYYFTSFVVGGSATVNLSGGQVIIFLGGSGPFTFAGNGVVNGSNETNNLRIYSNSSADIDLTGTTSFAGVIFAPNSTISLSGATEFYGAMYGQVSVASGSVGLHYDTSLPSLGEPEAIDVDKVTVVTNSWSQG